MRTICILSLAVLLVGCAAPANTRSSIGAGRLGDASVEVVLPSVSGEPAPVALTDEGPSVTGLDRSGWEMKVVLVPVDHTEHHAHLTDLRTFWRDDATGASYPTLESALGEEGSAAAEIRGLFLWPFKAARDVVTAPARLVNTSGGLTHSPGRDAYERAGG